MQRQPENILDELLVLQIQNGEQHAVSLLVRRWHNRLIGYAYTLTGNREAAEDAVQEAWLAAIKSIHRLQDPAAVGGWLRRIVRNKAVDWVRATQQQREIRERAEANPEPSPEEGTPPPGLPAVRVALRSLGEDHRLVLTLHYLDGLSVKEISRVTRLPVGTVKSRLHYGRNYLKERLKTLQDEKDE